MVFWELCVDNFWRNKINTVRKIEMLLYMGTNTTNK
jgi:hypothetical protein